MIFTDEPYMTIRDKELTYKQWVRFLKNELQEKDFGKRLYEHLHLHCGFIACRNKEGFYRTYFSRPNNVKAFFEFLWEPNKLPYARDLTDAMYKAYMKQKLRIERGLDDENTRSLNVLITEVERAKRDRDYAEKLLARLGR